MTILACSRVDGQAKVRTIHNNPVALAHFLQQKHDAKDPRHGKGGGGADGKLLYVCTPLWQLGRRNRPLDEQDSESRWAPIMRWASKSHQSLKTGSYVRTRVDGRGEGQDGWSRGQMRSCVKSWSWLGLEDRSFPGAGTDR